VNGLKRYLRWWIGLLSEPRSEFGGNSACPFAARAKLVTCSVEDSQDLAGILSLVEALPRWHVLVIEVTNPQGSRDVLRRLKGDLAARDLLALPSDPDRPMTVSGFRTTQHSHFLVIVQRRKELFRASEEARARGYYEHWTPKQQEWLEDRQ
jgi:hypothetical protein